MKSAGGSAGSTSLSTASATYVVTFEQRPRRTPRREQPALVGRLPRVARLLALAHRIDGMIRSGDLRDWADAARLVKVTRARMTQIANLLLLAPNIQESLAGLPAVLEGRELITERCLRAITAEPAWHEQNQRWCARQVNSIRLVHERAANYISQRSEAKSALSAREV